jgi:hypothetical protein
MSSGFMAGIGKGIADTGKLMQEDAYEAAREARLEAARERMERMRNQFQAERDASLHGMQVDRDETDREFRSIESETDRSWKSREKELEHGRDMSKVDRQHGHSMTEVERKAELTKESGGILGRVNTPAAITTVEWIAERLTGGDYQAAWNMAQQSKSNPQDLAARLYMARRKEASDGFEDITDEQIMQDVRSAMEMLNPSSARQEAPQQNTQMLMQQAQQAIQSGADPNAVRQRLIEMGVPESAIQF